MLRRLRIENLVLIREAELDFHAGLNAVTGETGAGKTIFAHAVGLLLGARADASAVGSAAGEAYVEAELDVPTGFFEEDETAPLGELRPEGEDGLVLARRVFGDGRTRAYAWGRAVAREDVAAAAERLLAMSGQFEQRRLGRASYQLDVLDAFAGSEQETRRREARVAWRELMNARRRHHELASDTEATAANLAELEALLEATSGLAPGEEEDLRTERQRLLHVSELGAGAAAAASALAPDDGNGAASLAEAAERALAPLASIAPELAAAVEELRDLGVRLREVGSDVHRYVSTLESDPARLEHVEERLESIADMRRRFACGSVDELLERRAEAEAVLDAARNGVDPVEAARTELVAAERRVDELAGHLRDVRQEAAPRFAEAVAEQLRDVGLGEGEFAAELRERELGPVGGDEVRFLVRPNAGLPLGPVAETASGGELSRIALAIAAVAGGETMVFDEIDAGVGGVTAHRVAETLQRLARHSQVITITHLPQIASVADAHFRVEKVAGDPTHTQIERLDEAERAAELERMLGGEDFLASIARAEGS